MAEQSPQLQPLLLIDMPYAYLSRVEWLRQIERARRLGANSLVISPSHRLHSLPNGQYDFTGRNNPHSDLISLLDICDHLGMQVVLDLNQTIEFGQASAWYLALSEALATLQVPSGPIVGFIGSVLPEWHLPTVQIPDRLTLGAWPGGLQSVRISDGLQRFRSDGSATVRVWSYKPLLMMLHAVGQDAMSSLPAASELADGGRLAWADAADVSVQVRHGPQFTYLFIENRRAESYSGVLTYRGQDASLLHLHVNLGAGRHATAILRDEEIAGVAFEGDTSEGAWLARSMRSSAVFNGGAGGVIPCGAGLLLTAAQSGRFQIRRPEGWQQVQAFRLMLDGTLFIANAQVEATHLTVPYVAEDDHGQTDLYIVLVGDAPPNPFLHQYLRMLSRARAMELRMLAANAPQLADTLLHLATELLICTDQQLDLKRYMQIWAMVDQEIQRAQEVPNF